jgi:hypothetical protein
MTSDNEKPSFQLDGPYLDILALKQSGLCCSQIVVKLLLCDLGRENPDLIRAMAALCFGGGHPSGTCGVLTGAGCALSLCLDGNPDNERPDPQLPLLLAELTDWFTVQAEHSYGGSRCADVLAASPDKRGCTLLLIATLEKLQSMLASTGSAEKRRNHDHP